MGDESSFRYRRDDGYTSRPSGSRPPQASQTSDDPLAELARLIGDEDPFADFADIAGDPAPEARPARAEAAPRPQFSAPPVERRFEDWQPGRRSGREAAADTTAPREQTAPREITSFREPTQQREPTSIGGLRGRTSSEPVGWDATVVEARFQAGAEPQRSTVRSGYGSLARKSETQDQELGAQPRQGTAQDGYGDEAPADEAYAYSAESGQDRYEEYDDTYDPAFGDEGYMPPHGEEVYDTEPRRRRGRTAVIAVAALIGLGVAATAGVFAFRMVGGSGSSSSADTAPVIKADTSPSKVAGPAPTGAQGSDGQKLIYDRVGGQPGQERVVPREEQPMDPSAAAAANAAINGNGQASPTDPKRVRTVAVRADGSVVPAAANGAAPQPQRAVANGAVPTAYAPTQNPVPAGAPAPRTVTTTTTTGQGAPVAAAPAAPALPPAVQAPAPGAQAAVTPPAATASGNYVVQVSSQKSEADAMGSWKVLQSRYPQLLGSYKATVRRADLGDKGIYYRAQVGPFATRDDATNLCNSLQAQGGTCIVTRN
ncbi:SPOR domain-containing protein [Aquabacter sp. CN5-332]|uniref:SPOR domain-containing protein n=1 Tax=Aquabacter sp. CN5-332 TaxID=3156608 RepID=UPI0032B46AB2